MLGGLSLRSIVATLLFLMILIILGLILQKYPTPSDPLFGFLATLFIGCFLSLIVCLSNIGKLVENDKLKTSSTTANQIKFSSCPEYWLKIRDDNNSGKVKCTNSFKTNSVYGNLTKSGEVYQFDPKFSNTTLTDMQDEAVYETENPSSTVLSSRDGSEKWITEGTARSSETPNEFSMQIYLDELNKSSNPCQLSKHFAWTEARSKCQV